MTEHQQIEFKIDPEKYRGMTPYEAERAKEQDRRSAIAADPGVRQVKRETEERQRAQEAEERRQAEADRKRREQDAAQAWEEEYQRRRSLWIAGGGADSEFDELWPEVKRQILMERVSGAEERRRREAFANFRL